MEDLMNAARMGDVNALYASMRLNSKILDEIDEFPLINTPLHVAASEGHTDFAVEILTLKPSFGRKLNPDGFSPLHLAVQCARFETAEQLLKIDSELVRVKGRERLTPLHWAAAMVEVKKGAAVDLLAELLCACPASIEDVTVRGETALHVAMKSSNVRAFQILLGWIWRTYNRHVLGWKDKEGNTVLHLAVSANQPEIVRMLTKKAPIIINEMNTANMTALDIASSYQNVEEASSNSMTAIREILNRAKASSSSSSLSLVKQLDGSNLADFLISPERPSEALIQFLTHCRRGLSMDMRSVILVVAVLIATATFQAVLSPPGGVSMDNINNNNNNNNTIEKVKFYCFYGFNSLTFSASVTVIILITPWRPFIPILVLQTSLLFLTVSYWASISIFSPPPWLNATMLFLSVPLPFVGLVYKITFWLVEKIMRMDLYYRWSWTQQVVNFFTLLIGRAGRLRLLQMGRVGRFRMLYRVLQHRLDTPR